MPSIFSHAVAGVACGNAYARRAQPFKFWLLIALCAMLPDVDVVGFALGISYGDMLGHRGLTHSLPFALLVGFAVVALAFREVETFTRRWWSLVAFFAPFSARRYFFPWRPIGVSPIGLGFFSERGLEVFESELVWVWLPSLALVAAVWALRKLIKLRATS